MFKDSYQVYKNVNAPCSSISKTQRLVHIEYHWQEKIVFIARENFCIDAYFFCAFCPCVHSKVIKNNDFQKPPKWLDTLKMVDW